MNDCACTVPQMTESPEILTDTVHLLAATHSDRPICGIPPCTSFTYRCQLESAVQSPAIQVAAVYLVHHILKGPPAGSEHHDSAVELVGGNHVRHSRELRPMKEVIQILQNQKIRIQIDDFAVANQSPHQQF